MKKALTLLLAVFGILCFSSVVSAEGFAIQADFDSMGRDVNFMAFNLGGEYDIDSFIVGASYNFAFSYSPALPSGVKRADDLFYLYGGYKFIKEKDSSLALIGGYNFWNKKIDSTNTEEEKASYICLGTRGTVNLEPFNVSILLLYGVSGEYKEFFNGSEMYSTNSVSLFYLQLKGSYQLTNSLGTFVTCRYMISSAEDVKVGMMGLGLGMEYRF